uniref:SAM-dependent MTase TRM10-type domain-containing protein n=1 Tax=Angiostrongylus cantonensis TaxID=6313 RepID=A0A0K0DKW3_ANGCA
MPNSQCLLRGLLRCFSQSSSVISSPNDATTDLKLLFPSDSFMRKSIRRPSHREKLSSLISELQVSFLHTAFSKCFHFVSRKLGTCGALVGADDGEVVYAARSHNFIELRGQDFRSKRNISKCNEMLPKLVIDCRFLAEFSATVQSAFARQIQALHDSNWTSRIPFNISLVNFRPDGQLDGIVKILQIFQHGCIKQISAENVMYISWRATRFIPETPPSNIRAVVVCASNDIQPWSSSVSAAQKEGINAYRLPIERYVRPTEKRKFFSLRKTSAILRSYFCGDNLDTAFNEVVESSPNQSHYNDSIERDLLQVAFYPIAWRFVTSSSF